MLGPLAACADTFLPSCLIMYEIACTGGIPDVVLLDVDRDALSERGDRAPLEQPIDVLVMLALQSSPALPISVQALAAECHVSVGHLGRTVLPRLQAGRHVIAAVDGTGWSTAYMFRSLARRVVTIEAKLKDWRGGLAQAARHSAIADEAWLVIDESAIRPAAAHPAHFAMFDVGLASLSAEGRLKQLLAPQLNRSRQPGRELLVERALALHLAGRVSGDLPRVFGTVLVASDGRDPRLVDNTASLP